MSQESTGARILCFIPVRNCESPLKQVLSEFQGETLEYIEEILVVDDSSDDRTFDLAKEILATIPKVRTTILQNSKNDGIGFSHKLAFSYALEAKYDYLLVLHGDGSVSIRTILPYLRKIKFISKDMVLSAPEITSKLDRCLNFIATVVTGRSVESFEGGPLSIYRMSSFILDRQAPVLKYPNDESFRQYALLFGRYHHLNIEFLPVPMRAKATYGFFLKSVYLLLKYFVFPKRTIITKSHAVFHDYNHQRTDVSAGAQKTKSTKSPRVQPTEVQFLDLLKMRIPDAFGDGSDDGSWKDLRDESYLHVRMKMGAEICSSRGLKENFLKLFQIYSPKKIVLDLNIDHVFKTKQLYDFLVLCRFQSVHVHLITMKGSNLQVWEKYAPIVNAVTLNFEVGTVSRSDFLETVKFLSGFPLKLQVNVLSDPMKFYYSFGLYQEIKESKAASSVFFQPYYSLTKPDDHVVVQGDDEPVTVNYLNWGRHHALYMITPDAQAYQWHKDYGFTYAFSDQVEFKQISVKVEGEIVHWDGGQDQILGTLFDGTSKWIPKTVAIKV